MTTPSPADDAHLQPAVAAEFASLAGLLAAATDAQWDTPSMCRGWRVREVVAHMTMPARYSEEEFNTGFWRCGFDFTRLSNEMASRDASLQADQLVAGLRSGIMQRWTPPGGGYHGALTHVVIHGLDVTVPLGGPRCSPTRPSGSSSITSRPAAATPTSGPSSTAAISRPATSTGRTAQARSCAARPQTWHSRCAAAPSLPDGSRASRYRAAEKAAPPRLRAMQSRSGRQPTHSLSLCATIAARLDGSCLLGRRWFPLL